MKKGFIEAIEDEEVTVLFEDNSKKIFRIRDLPTDFHLDDIVWEEDGILFKKGKDDTLLTDIKKLAKKTMVGIDKKPLRLGIVGPGKIAHTVCTHLKDFPQFKMEAVASREIDRAISFQKQFGFRKAYQGYEALLADPDIDLVYIATPHAFHYEQMKQAIAYKKNILCEKAFCLELDQVKEIYELAKKEQVFVGEALVPAFLPGMRVIENIIQAGKIGKITHAKAVFGANIKSVPRVIQKELGGGAMYDIGIYPLYFIYYLFGKQVRIQNKLIKWEKAVDVKAQFQMQYAHMDADIIVSVEEDLGMYAVLDGTGGSMHIENVARPEKLIIYNTNNEIVETIDPLRSTSGYEFEFLAAKEAISKKQIETDFFTHQDGIELYSLLLEVLNNKD